MRKDGKYNFTCKLILYTCLMLCTGCTTLRYEDNPDPEEGEQPGYIILWEKRF